MIIIFYKGKISLQSVQAEIVDQSLTVAPSLFDLNPTAEIDMTLKEFFHILPRPGGYTLEHCSVFADNNALVAVLFTVNYCLYIHDVGVLTFTHFFNADGNSVRNFPVKISKYLFTDHLRRNNTFGLIGQSVLGEEKHAFLGKLFKLVFKNVDIFVFERADGNHRFLSSSRSS